MNKKYAFNTKVNIRPTKATYIFLVVLNICLAVTMLIGVIKIIAEGFRWETFAHMALAFVIVTAFKRRPTSKEHYEAAIATVVFHDDILEVSYTLNGTLYKKYECSSNAIKNIQYSDQLICTHIVGAIKCFSGKKEEAAENLYIYLDRSIAKEFLQDIGAFACQEITYMDR